MADLSDVAATKACRRMFGKRGIDITLADVRVMHGVCHVRGVVSLIKGHESGQTNVEEAMQQVAGILRRRPDIRDVSLDVYYKGGD